MCGLQKTHILFDCIQTIQQIMEGGIKQINLYTIITQKKHNVSLHGKN